MSAALPGLGPEVGGVDVTPRRTVGRTTGVVAGAGTAGPALAAIIVHLWPNLAGVEWALATLLGLALGLFAGYLLPPVKPAVVSPSPDATAGGPDYEGEAGAAPGDVLTVPPATPGPDVYEGRHVREGEVVAVPDPVDPVEGEDPVDPARRPGM